MKTGPLLALASAVLFGLSSPLAKILTVAVSPWLLAALFFLGSGAGMLVIQVSRQKSFALRPGEIPTLLGVIFFGGVAGPTLLMYGISLVAASTASLLLTFEGAFTAAIAWIIYREKFSPRALYGLVAVIAGGIALQIQPGLHADAASLSLIGSGCVLGATLSWAIDNNFTRKISLNDPVTLTMIKSLIAGVTNFILALIAGAHLPRVNLIFEAASFGFITYGLSIVCFILALRSLGAARTGIYFSTAPFVGTAVSVIFLHDPFTVNLAVASLLMMLGIFLNITDQSDTILRE